MKSRIESNSQPIDWSHSKNRILNDNFCILEQLKCSNNFRDWSKSIGGGGGWAGVERGWVMRF